MQSSSSSAFDNDDIKITGDECMNDSGWETTTTTTTMTTTTTTLRLLEMDVCVEVKV